jgi:hypothetical protein
MADFVVVSIPSRIAPSACGSGFGMMRGYCNIEIYVKLKKSGMEDVNKMAVMIDEVLEAMPYQDQAVQVSRPQVMLRGNDGLGFSATLIRAELLIK